MQNIDIPHVKRPSESLVTGGQPDQAQLRQVADAGVKHVINLRPIQEQGEDEAPAVEALGMHYHHIPIAGPQDINAETVALLNGLLREIGSDRTLFHCATGNRVGALLALRAAWHEGKDADAALQVGRDAGLTKLEPLVEQLLKSSAAGD